MGDGDMEQPIFFNAIAHFSYEVMGRKGKKEVGDIAQKGMSEPEWIDHLANQAKEELAEQHKVDKSQIKLAYVSIDVASPTNKKTH